MYKNYGWKQACEGLTARRIDQVQAAREPRLSWQALEDV
jgi:hypothetical protein